MAVAARKQEGSTAPRTMVYSYAESAMRPERGETPKAPQTPTAPEAHPHNNPSAGRMIAAILAVAMIMSMFLLVVARYEAIAAKNATINGLRSVIADKNKIIAELDVQLQCAVDIEAARATALEAGMQYPTSGQIVKIGE